MKWTEISFTLKKLKEVKDKFKKYTTNIEMYSPNWINQNMDLSSIQNHMFLAKSNPANTLHSFSVRNRRPSIPTSGLHSPDLRSKVAGKSNQKSDRANV